MSTASHPQFADRLRPAVVGDHRELLTRWGKAVARAVGAATLTETLRWAVVCLDLPGAREASESLRGHVRRFDPSLSADGDELAVALLAGSALAELWRSTPSALADAGALALLTGTLRGQRVPEHRRPFLNDATTYLARRTQARGWQQVVPLPESVASLTALNATGMRVPAGAADIANGDDVEDHVNRLRVTVQALAQHQQALASAYNHQLALRAEEGDIAWWVLGEHSRDYGRPLHDVAPAAVPLVVGKELADLVRVPPGPFATRAVLGRMLRLLGARRPTTLGAGEAVEALATFRAGVAEVPPLPEHGRVPPPLTPVLGALRARAASEAPASALVGTPVATLDAAGPVMAATLSLEVLPAVDLAEQFFDELMLVRVAGEEV